jgi:hypothetical protein
MKWVKERWIPLLFWVVLLGLFGMWRVYESQDQAQAETYKLQLAAWDQTADGQAYKEAGKVCSDNRSQDIEKNLGALMQALKNYDRDYASYLRAKAKDVYDGEISQIEFSECLLNADNDFGKSKPVRLRTWSLGNN